MNPLMLSFLAVLVLFNACIAPARAAAGIPDSVTMAEMRKAAGHGHGLRLIGPFGQREFRHLELDSTGVRALVSNSRPALFVTADTPPPAPPPAIPWSRIAEVRTTHQHKFRGMLIGTGTGFALGAATVGLKSGSDTSENWLAGLIVLGSSACGALAGTFLGSLYGSKTLYRSQEIH